MTVVSGHFKVGAALTPDSIGYTRDYLRRFEAADGGAASIGAMQ